MVKHLVGNIFADFSAESQRFIICEMLVIAVKLKLCLNGVGISLVSLKVKLIDIKINCANFAPDGFCVFIIG